MYYQLTRPRIIHFECTTDWNGDINELKVQFFPKMEIFEYEGNDIPDFYRTWRAQIRWTFRLLDDDTVIMSYISEQTILLVYQDDPNNLTLFGDIIKISHYAISREFEYRKSCSWLSAINPFLLPQSYVDEAQLTELLSGMKRRADEHA